MVVLARARARRSSFKLADLEGVPQPGGGRPSETYNREEQTLVEEEDDLQQVGVVARDLLGLNNAGNDATGPAQQKGDTFITKVLRPLATAPLYPVQLVQVLIQLGYEPRPPERRYSFLFGRYLYYYPGIFGYAKSIVQQEGWGGLYRGLGASLCSSLVGITAHSIIHPAVSRAVLNLPMTTVSEASGRDVPDTEPQNLETTRSILVQATRSFMIGVCTSVSVEMVVRPFNVIVIRAIAQHVGKEDLYSSVLHSIRQIYTDEGIRGFYAGLVPALLGHAFSCLIYSSMWIFFEMVAINSPYNWMKLFVRGVVAIPLLAYIPRTYSYPFSLMTNIMAVNNTQLTVAPKPSYGSWLDCYSHLKSSGALYRGSVVIFPRFAYESPPLVEKLI